MDCIWTDSHRAGHPEWWTLSTGREPQHCTGHISSHPLTALGSDGTSGQPEKQLRQAHAKIPHLWRMAAADPGKDLARVEIKPGISTLKTPSCYTPKLLVGKQHLLLRRTRAQLLFRSQSVSALFPHQTSPGSFRECTNRSMGNTETQLNFLINGIKIMRLLYEE